MNWLVIDALLRLETKNSQSENFHRALAKELCSDTNPTIEDNQLLLAIKECLASNTDLFNSIEDADLWVHSDVVNTHPMDNGVTLLTMNASLRIYFKEGFNVDASAGLAVGMLESQGKCLVEGLEGAVAEHLSSFAMDELVEPVQYADVWVNKSYRIDGDDDE